ncbi:MAG: TPM domain-containing protein [Treponema sp.]|jgi:uncharacterized protein|nr:TPM domain-containing protein [Treponema sp.]
MIAFVLLSFVVVLHIDAQELPKHQGFINDFAHILNDSEQSELEAVVQTLKEKTGVELAVVSIDSFKPFTSLEEYAVTLFEQWKIGEQSEDNGILFIVALKERRVKIEVGYGLEGIITDSIAGRILDSAIVPDFKNNNFSAGLIKGTHAIANRITQAYGNGSQESDIKEKPSNQELIAILIFLLTDFMIIIYIASIVKGRIKRRNAGTGTIPYQSNMPSTHYPPRPSHDSFKRPSSGGSSHKGGFGGGHSGGGGASRSF